MGDMCCWGWLESDIVKKELPGSYVRLDSITKYDYNAITV